MKKMFFTLCMSLMLLFVIWVIMFAFYVDDWENITSYHLDLYSMVYRFSHNSGLNTDFLATFRSMISSLTQYNHNDWIKMLLQNTGAIYTNSVGWDIAIAGLNVLVNPLYTIGNVIIILGYLLVLILQFLIIVSNIATALFDFVFVPIWIKY